MIYLAIYFLALGAGVGVLIGLFVAYLNRNAPREDSDFLRACGWREEAEREVDALRNPDRAAMRKYMRGEQ